MKCRAVIFDLDGVLVETHGYHCEAWRQTGVEQGFIVPESNFNKIRGLSRSASFNLLFAHFKISEQIRVHMFEQKSIRYESLVMNNATRLAVEGCHSLLSDLRGSGCALAIYSSSKLAKLVLETSGLTHFFDYISDGFDRNRPKPFPDRLLSILTALKVAPDSAVLLDDAEVGLQAASAAGVPAIFVGSNSNFEKTVALASLRGVALADLVTLTELAITRRARNNPSLN
ncbi:Beta-phosphoglucomutase [Pseudomonas fluorescens]|nr:Beta-phosphoglucomutase [Pseudomonas fluorescens]